METIAEFERMAARHWRGTEEEWLGDWLLRAAEGFTGRANSALPLGDHGRSPDAAVAAVTGWYRARGLPPMIAVPTPGTPDSPRPPSSPGQVLSPGDALDLDLARRGWLVRSSPAFVMVAGLPLDAQVFGSQASGGQVSGSQVSGSTGRGLADGRAVAASRAPDDGWAARYHYRGQDHLPPIARKVLTSAEDQAFVSIREGGQVLAIARLSLAGGWAGLTAVEVNPAYRRQGLGAAITAAACELAARRGLTRVFLQVEVDNNAAQALYRGLGFRYSHRYHYRVAPA